MTISRQEISRLISETPVDFIIPSYRDTWEGIRAIHDYMFFLSSNRQEFIVSVYAHANHRKTMAEKHNFRKLSLPIIGLDDTIEE